MVNEEVHKKFLELHPEYRYIPKETMFQKEIYCSFCNSIFIAKHWSSKFCDIHKNKKNRSLKKKRFFKNEEERKNARKEYDREYRRKNRDKFLKIHRDYYYKNREKLLSNKKYLIKQNIYQKFRKDTDINYKLSTILRRRINGALKNNVKNGSSVKDLGCSVEELKIHLEKQFKEGMNWENHGINGWHIDHIIPLSSFDLTNREQFLKACHYTNLQPLWSIDNLKKGAK